MLILLIFESFAREKKQESSENLTIVLNLFAEIIVHSAFFTSVSMHQKMGIGSNNAFFKPQGVRLYRYLCTFLDIPPFPLLDSHFMERQQREISAASALKIRDKRFL